MRVGILELLIADVNPSAMRRFYCQFVSRHYASIMPQAVSAWSRQLGHRTFYATYYGQADPRKLLPDDLDVVFLSAYTSASALAYALAGLYRRSGAVTVLGGPHAKGFPQDASRFFDVVVRDCDRTLIAEILRDPPRNAVLASSRPLVDLPAIKERLPEVETAYLHNGHANGTTFIGLIASLGCPYACDFCADWNNPYRLTSLERLEADLRFLSERFPRARVAFHDPNFGVKFDTILEVLERIPAPGPNRYLIQTSLSVLNEQRLARLRATGCYFMAPGIESWGEYSSKSNAKRTTPRAKLARVVEHFERIAEYIPALQANFIPGVDADAGDEPIRLTQEFMARMPAVWTNFNVPTPFGGTPLYERHLAEKRILATIPFAFYYTPYLVTRLKNYSAEQYYGHLIDLFTHLASPGMIMRRVRAFSGAYHALHVLRLVNAKRIVRELRTIWDLLRSDRDFRAFHEGESEMLPPFYATRFRSLLGRYAELLTPENLRPVLTSDRVAT